MGLGWGWVRNGKGIGKTPPQRSWTCSTSPQNFTEQWCFGQRCYRGAGGTISLPQSQHRSQGFFLPSLIHSALAGGAQPNTFPGWVWRGGLPLFSRSFQALLETGPKHGFGKQTGSWPGGDHSLGSHCFNHAPEIRHQAFMCGPESWLFLSEPDTSRCRE